MRGEVCYKVCYWQRKTHGIERYTVGFYGGELGI